MKKLSLALMMIAFINANFAQTPQYIPYQAVARNSVGNLLVNQTVSLRFTIHETSGSGTVDYQETQSATTNNLGLFTVNIGNGTRITGTLSGIPWGNGTPKYTQVEIDPNGGSSYTDMGASQVMSVPYALYAGNATSVTSSNLTESTSDVLSITGGNNSVVSASGTAIQVKKASGSQDGYLSSTDWTTFNNKQGPISLTTNNSSGVATFSSNTLNVPNYTLAGLGLTAGSGIGISGGTVSETLPFTSLTVTGNNGAATISSGTLNIPTYTLAGLGGQATLTPGNGITIASNTISDNIWTFSSNNIYNANSGNVGIGTTSPLSLLNVGNGGTHGKFTVYSQDNYTGEIQIGNPLTNGEASIGFISGASSFGGYQTVPTSTSGAYRLWTLGAASWGASGNVFGIGNQGFGGLMLAVDTTGFVGIGTTTAVSPLEVIANGTTGSSYGALDIFQPNLAAGTQAAPGRMYLKLGVSQTTYNEADLSFNYIGTGGSTANYLGIGFNDVGPIAAFTAAGTVGIGTTNPAATLHVAGTGIYTGELYVNAIGTGTGTGATGSLQIGDGTIAKAVGNSFWVNSGVSIGTYSGTNSPTNGLIVSGQAGIGTSSPSYKFQVTNTSNSDGMLLQNANGGGGATTNIYFETWATEGSPGAAISGVDDGDFSAHLTFSTRVPGSVNNALAERMRIASNGAVGIGTNNPTQALLVVNGTQNNTLTYAWLAEGQSNPSGYASNVTAAYSIYASGRAAALEFDAYSDARIKNITGRTDNATDLNTLMNLHITNYHFIDTIEKGNKMYKKVIAQEVEQVYPDAISKTIGVIPDIYKIGELKNGRVTLANNLKAGDRVRLVTSNKSDVYDVTAADNEGFTVRMEGAGKVFVYGREVNDFRSVDYDALTTLNISATQELTKRLADAQAKNESLEKEIGVLKSANSDLTQKVNGLTSTTGDIQLLYKQLEDLKSLMLKNGIRTEK